MALLMRGEELVGPIRITRRNQPPAGVRAAGIISFESDFLVLPGNFVLVDDDGARQDITITLVFPSQTPLRGEAHLQAA